MKCGNSATGQTEPHKTMGMSANDWSAAGYLYTPVSTPRLEYIVATLFPGLPIVTSQAALQQSHSIRINYSAEKIPGTFQVKPAGLLQETGIRQINMPVTLWRSLPAYFISDDDLGFDLLSASFYLLSRYEEYLPHQTDAYNRYAPEQSLAYRDGFLQQPLINRWMKEFRDSLARFFVQENLPRKRFRFQPTYDIDIAYAYRYHPLWKSVLGFYKDLLTGHLDRVLERGNVYSGRVKDPFDVYAWLDDLHRQGVRPIFFLLGLLQNSPEDRNLLLKNKAIRRLYRALSEHYQSGWHPSRESGKQAGLFQREKQALEQLIKQPLYHSRFHYLSFQLPGDYRKLAAAGIQYDYSMGYGSVNGFRASYADPFYWFDLEENKTTSLLVHPFCFMDSAAFFGEGLDADAAGKELQAFADTLRGLNAHMTIIAHNHFLTEQPKWLHWRNIYAAFIREMEIT